MRLRVLEEGCHRGVSIYRIEPHFIPHNRSYGTREEATQLQKLKPRIEAMAQRELGSNFRRLVLVAEGYILELWVKPGTSKEKKFELRDLFGWINLFDSEKDKRKRR